MGLFRRQVDAVLTRVAWRRTVAFDDIEWVPIRTGSRPPAAARNVRVRHLDDYTSTITGLDPNGVPEQEMRNTHRTVYESEMERWSPGRVLEATGYDQADVHWPKYELGPDERVHERGESYTAVFTIGGSGKEHKAKLDEATWRSLEIGGPYRLELGVFGHVHAVARITGE
jgi:hypothetical protein